MVCEDGIKKMCDYLRENPQGTNMRDGKGGNAYEAIKGCQKFTELHGKAGDVFLAHPFMVSVGRRQRSGVRGLLITGFFPSFPPSVLALSHLHYPHRRPALPLDHSLYPEWSPFCLAPGSDLVVSLKYIAPPTFWRFLTVLDVIGRSCSRSSSSSST